MERREEILSGILSFPKGMMEILKPETEFEEDTILDFFNYIWVSYLREQNASTLIWYEKFNNSKQFNRVLMHLSKSKWIESVVESDYAYCTLNEDKLLQWVSKEELIEVKLNHKFNKYKLDVEKPKFFNRTKIKTPNGEFCKDTGLIRKGFMKAGGNRFKYDVTTMKKYVYEIADNVCKSLDLLGSSKDVTYEEVVTELLGYYATTDNEYTLGDCINDSRGRAIFQCTRKVFNPIACKDARALIVCRPQALTYTGLDSVHAAIAELLGYRGANIGDKINYGQEAYIDKQLPSLTEMRDTKNYDDLHKLIWLERIYNNLDNYDGTNWTVPIEIDATASMIGLIGVLLNNHSYMKECNLIGTTFGDPWKVIPELSRIHHKKAYTPILYGSSRGIKELWDKNELTYDVTMLNSANNALKTGFFSSANNFKNMIINNVKPHISMDVHIWNEKFTVECNRFKWEETKLVTFPIYTSSQGLVKRVARKVALVPDVNQFKRYFVTCLIHNLDSQIADTICKHVNWILPNHDSFIQHPNDTLLVRNIYTSQLKKVYDDRHTILRNYFKSIGIELNILLDVDKTEIEEFSPYCLK